jgi:protoporphyrinogen/coproporphyrinogen III oxidase
MIKKTYLYEVNSRYMKHFGIIGAGITGLTMAYKLMRLGYSVTVLEANDYPGGAVRSYRKEGWLAEAGPNSIQDSDTSVGELVESLGLESRLLSASTAAKRRYIVRYKKPQLVPNSLLTAVNTPLFSLKAKLAVLGEPFRSGPKDNEADESLADFVRRRLGQEFLDYTINPMVGGIYAGNPEALSVQHAFAKVKALEVEFGSLIKGALGRMIQRKRSGIKAYQKRVLSFPDGLGELTDAMAFALGNRLVTGFEVKNIQRNPEGTYLVSKGKTTAGCEPLQFDRLIFAGTTHTLKSIEFSGFTSLPSETLNNVLYAPVHSITLGYYRHQIEHPLDGFGVLIPEVEPFKILGCLFTSSIFSHRAPDNGVTLTVFIGGMRRPELTTLDDDALLSVIKTDLNTLLKIEGEPEFVQIHRWNKAIPQYETGYGKVLAEIDEIEKENPGFELAGNYKTGISVDACIRYGWAYEPKDHHDNN